jgi:uncharacterized protein DUF1349
MNAFKERSMCRSVFALIVFPVACTAIAAPAPKGNWDYVIDPDHDCKFASKGGKVTIELPGTDHDLAPKRKRFNAPRLLREVEGDFVMQVRVSGSFRPSAKSSVKEEDASVAAGFVLAPADENYIRLEYGAYCRKGEQHICPAFRMRGERIFNMEMDWAEPWKPDPSVKKEPHIYLSLERRGHFIYEAISHDGKTWTYDFKVEVKELPKKVKVGLAAYSTSTEPFKACFDQFKLSRDERKAHEPGIVIDSKFAK